MKWRYKNKTKIQKRNEEQQKPPRRFSQIKYHHWEFLSFDFTKMIAEVLLVLPLYLFFIWWWFQPLINYIEPHKKPECLKDAIDKVKGHLLGKWTLERLDKASDETINKKYAEYIQRELNEKGEKTGKARGKDVISLYSSGISGLVKIRDVHKLHQDIENDLIIKDQMAGLGCLLVCTFGNLLAPVLVLVHTINNSDLGNKNESYESESCII